MRALFVSASLVITIALTSVLASAADDAPVAEPTIDSVTPGILAPWTYVVVDGTDLANEDGTCDVKLGSVQAYIEDCSPGQIVAIVPWSPGADTLSVSSAGAASDSQLVSVSGDAPAADQIIAGRLHVNLVDGASIAQVLDANEVLALGAHELAAPGDYYTKGWYRVDVVEGTEIAVALSIMADPDVLYAGPVPRPIPQAEPNDPLYSSQWYLAKIDMPGAWNVSKGSGTKIAIIDTGFDASHPDLSGRLLPGWNCDGGTSVSALNNHGTFVAGIAAANTDTNPAYGIAGVAWDAQIIPLRLETLIPPGSCQEDDDVYLIEKAIQLGADVINMSYGGLVAGPGQCAKLRDAQAAGIVTVAAAGNDNSSTANYPAACDGVIAVGATEPNDSKAGYSSYGSWVDISAPGGTGTPVVCTGDASTKIYGPSTPRPPDHILSCGTSAAAPQMAGVAALLAATGLNRCDIEATILNPANVDPITWQGGIGRLNAAKALNSPYDCPQAAAVAQADVNGNGRNDLLHRRVLYADSWLAQVNPRFDIVSSDAFSSPSLLPGHWQTGDFDGDGMTDHVQVFDTIARTYLSDGDGTFTQQSFNLPGGYDASSGWFLAWNLDGDADTDLVHICCTGQIKVWLSNGDGTFTISAPNIPYSPADALSTSWRMGDFNGDGLGDLIHLWKRGDTRVWLSNGDGTFTVTSFTPWSNYGLQGRWRAGDFNGDGRSDLIHLAAQDFANIWISDGDGTFTVTGVSAPPGYDMRPGHWRTGDFDGDGDTDLFHVCCTDSARLWLSTGGAGFAAPTTVRAPGGYSMMSGTWRTGDFTRDGTSDVLHAIVGDSVRLWLGSASAPLAGQGEAFTVPDPGYDVGAGVWVGSDYNADRDGDGWLDGADPCPSWPGPPPAGDDDCDGFSTVNEGLIGTDPYAACPVTGSHDAWPPDFDMNRIINIFDVAESILYFNTTVPPTSPRYDIDPDGVINALDVALVLPPVFGSVCIP